MKTLFGEKIIQISGGWEHSLALTGDGNTQLLSYMYVVVNCDF